MKIPFTAPLMALVLAIGAPMSDADAQSPGAVARELCTPDRTLTMSGAPISWFDPSAPTALAGAGGVAIPTDITVGQIIQMGEEDFAPRCDCSELGGGDSNQEVYFFSGEDASQGFTLDPGTNRVRAGLCSGEAVSVPRPSTRCPSMAGYTAQAPFVVESTTGTSWSSAHLSEACLDNSPPCPDGYSYDTAAAQCRADELPFVSTPTSGMGTLVTQESVSSVVASCPGSLTWNGTLCTAPADVTYSCTTGTLNTTTNECERAATQTANNACPSGYTLNQAQTQCTAAIVTTTTCPTGWTVSGSDCTRAATSSHSCPVGTLNGDQCETSATQDYSCSTGSLSGSNCTQNATATYSCTTGTVDGNKCKTAASSSYHCPSGTSDGAGYCDTSEITSYYCSSGTLSGSTCTTTSTSSSPATPSTTYSCSSGDSLSGSTCTSTSPATATTTYSCPSGGSLSGSTCTTTSTYTATPSTTYSCSSGDSLSGSTCTTTTTSTYSATPSTTYSCSSGDSLSGSTCTSTSTYAATPIVPACSCSVGTLNGSTCTSTSSADCITTYSCPSGGTLSGTTCTTSSTSPADSNTTYSCSSGTLNGDQCETTTTTPATQTSGPPYSCPGSRVLDGGRCYRYDCYDYDFFNCHSFPATPTITYSCSSGTLNGSTCTTTSTSSATATTTYSCSSGTLNGSTCTTESSYSADPNTTCSCSSGTLSGSTCTTTSPAHCPPTTYSCDSGGSLSGSTCTITSTYSATSNTTYSCSSGDSLSGSTCTTTTTSTYSATPSTTYSCSSGTLSGSTCTSTYSASTTTTYSCSSGTLSGDECLTTTTSTSPALLTTSCPSGFFHVPSLSLCSKAASTVYSCSSGTLSGSSCYTSATATYSCPTGWSLSGSTCTRAASYSYVCNTGWSLSGSTCSRDASTNYSCSTGTLGGSTCTIAGTANRSCPVGGNDNGTQCVAPVTVGTPTYSCAAYPGFSLDGTVCEKAADASYSCAGVGGTLNGSDCTDSQSAQATTWTVTERGSYRAWDFPSAAPAPACPDGTTAAGMAPNFTCDWTFHPHESFAARTTETVTGFSPTASATLSHVGEVPDQETEVEAAFPRIDLPSAVRSSLATRRAALSHYAYVALADDRVGVLTGETARAGGRPDSTVSPTDATSPAQAVRMLRDIRPGVFLETQTGAGTCPSSAPLDSVTGLCDGDAPALVDSAPSPSSSPAANCQTGWAAQAYCVDANGTVAGKTTCDTGDTQVGVYCERTYTTQTNPGADQSSTVSYEHYPKASTRPAVTTLPPPDPTKPWASARKVSATVDVADYATRGCRFGNPVVVEDADSGTLITVCDAKGVVPRNDLPTHGYSLPTGTAFSNFLPAPGARDTGPNPSGDSTPRVEIRDANDDGRCYRVDTATGMGVLEIC